MSADTFGNFALFDNATMPDAGGILLHDATDLIEAHRPEEVASALETIETAARRGMYAAGYCAYELGHAFEPRLHHLLPPGGKPLLRFQLFSERTKLTAGQRAIWLHERGGNGPLRLPRVTPGLSPDEHAVKVSRVRELIGDGDVYQVNLTFRLAIDDCENTIALYSRLRETSRAGACAFLRFPDEEILSFSPELFFTVRGSRITARPMKGTVSRAADADLDQRQRQVLASDEKQQAENLMIVDLIRNDLSRVTVPGSVHVTDLFTVETYPRFHTLTSGIEGTLAPQAALSTIMAALFPCGSVTGAPKIRAMEIIHAVEDAPRGIYCGAIGMLSSEEMAFSVAIRTLAFRDGKGVMGTGGGIVWDSRPASEYEECLLKANFLTQPEEPFRLIETLRWEPNAGFPLLDRHLQRLASSSRHFGFRCDRQKIRQQLERAVSDASQPMRVRLTLGVRGDLQVECVPIEFPNPASWTFGIAPLPMDSRDWRVHHKTTARQIYDEPLRRLQNETGCDEVLFVNERGELTEGSRTTIFLERDGIWYTPPLSSGLLDGCLRRELLEKGPQRVVERLLRPEDLASGLVWLGNSVRGLIPARAAGPI